MNKAILAMLLAGGAVLAFPVGGWMMDHSEGKILAIAREWGRLAPLPASATGLRTAALYTPRSGDVYVKFEAPAEEIEQFICRSPGLQAAEVEPLAPDHQFLPDPKEELRMDREHLERERNRFSLSRGRGWFDLSIKSPGRRYAIPMDRNAYSGEVVVDDRKHVVFIRASRR